MNDQNLVLGIETSGLLCSVAWYKEGRVLLEFNIEESNKHAELLADLIEKGFAQLSLKHDEVNLVCVSQGPGSFTGLRIGMAYAKGFCFALEKPLIAVSNFVVLANSVQTMKNTLAVLIDAHRERVYFAKIDGDTYRIKKTDVISNAMLKDQLADVAVVVKQRHLILPDNLVLDKTIIQAEVTAGVLCRIGYSTYFQDGTPSLNEIEPAYLQKFAGAR